MKRTRSKPISDVVLSKADLAHLFALLQRQAADDGDAGFSPTVTIVSDDGTITETDDPTIFDDDIVDHRKSRRIELRYSDHLARRISVILEEEERGSWRKSAFTVSGDEAAWVDARFAELERLLAAVRPQSKLVARLRWVIVIPAAIAIAYSWTIVLSRDVQLLLPAAAGGPPLSLISRFFGEHRLLLYQIFLILFALPWLVLAHSLVGWVERLWPAVEFDFGPEHKRRRRKVRFRLAVIATLLVLPIFIALIDRSAIGPS
jgi:hypothetical protein